MGESRVSAQAPAAAMRRMALGTAQFGLAYGVANSVGQVTIASVQQILARASAAGLDTLDTAVAYGESESVLGRAGVSNWRIVSKLPPLPPGVRNVRGWIDEQTHGSLQRL